MSTQLTYKKYTAQFSVDVENGTVCGRVLEINDVLAFEGKTVEEATQEFYRTVDAYLEFCRKKGIEPEKPFSGKLLFRTKTPDDHRRVYLAAAREGKTINAWLQDVTSRAAELALNDGQIAIEPTIALDPNAALTTGMTFAEDENSFLEVLHQQVKGLLKNDGPSVMGQFVNSARTIRTGLQSIQPCLKAQTGAEMGQLTQAIVAVGFGLRCDSNASESYTPIQRYT
jgi:predicted HicB family RNase H-like nuclease